MRRRHGPSGTELPTEMVLSSQEVPSFDVLSGLTSPRGLVPGIRTTGTTGRWATAAVRRRRGPSGTELPTEMALSSQEVSSFDALSGLASPGDSVRGIRTTGAARTTGDDGGPVRRTAWWCGGGGGAAGAAGAAGTRRLRRRLLRSPEFSNLLTWWGTFLRTEKEFKNRMHVALKFINKEFVSHNKPQWVFV